MSNFLIDKIKKYFPTSIKDQVKNAVLGYRSLGIQSRTLPNFIIVGVQKGGTASLFYYLIQHPQIVRPLQKQTFYFNERSHKSENWYRSNFPTISEMEKQRKIIGKQVVTLEATPDYIIYPGLPKRISTVLPQIKLICILRNPVARAISEYFYFDHYVSSSPSFKDKIQTEIKAFREKNEYQDYSKIFEYRHEYPILIRGLYELQLREWFNTFNLNQLLLVSSESFFKNKNETLNKIAEFVGIDAFQINDDKVYNKTSNKKQVPQESIQILNEFYKPFNEKLREKNLLDFNW